MAVHESWDYDDFKNAHVDVSETLRDTMSRNPFMRVFVANGYYDLATPHFATEYTFAHLGLDESLRENVRMGYYEAGHMMYVHADSRRSLAEELRAFIGEEAPALTARAGEDELRHALPLGRRDREHGRDQHRLGARCRGEGALDRVAEVVGGLGARKQLGEPRRSAARTRSSAVPFGSRPRRPPRAVSARPASRAPVQPAPCVSPPATRTIESSRNSSSATVAFAGVPAIESS